MKYKVTHGTYGEIVYAEDMWGRRSLSVGGTPLGKLDKKSFADGNGTVFRLDGNVITGLRLSDGRDTIQITAPIRWFVYVFAILPFILVMVLGNNRVVAEVFPVVGGAIGGGIGGLMMAVALYAAGRLRSPLLQIAVCIAITAVTVLICWGIGSAIVAAAT